MTQSSVGWRVTLQCRILRRPCSMTKKQYNSWNVNVGTVKKSNATIASRWFCRNASHRLAPLPGRCRRRRYRATVRSETTKPSFCSSPWIFGGPQSGILVRQASDQNSNFYGDSRPSAERPGTPAPIEAKASAMPADHRLGFYDDEDIRPATP